MGTGMLVLPLQIVVLTLPLLGKRETTKLLNKLAHFQFPLWQPLNGIVCQTTISFVEEAYRLAVCVPLLFHLFGYKNRL
jgi:hypothetical protein